MPKTPKIIEAANAFKRDLLEGEARATAEMTRLYRGVFEITLKRLEIVRAEIAREIADGKTPGPSRVFEKNRLQSLLEQTDSELAKFARGAQNLITARQAGVAALAQIHAAELGRVALGPIPKGATAPKWAKLPGAALEDLAGISGDGAPLSKILGQLSKAGAGAVREVMLSGIAQGQTPEMLARQLSQNLGAPFARSLTVLRTEDMRAYRLSQTRAFVANRDVIAGVEWFASLSFDTCASCLANHGRRFSASYVMESHPNCRCVLVPVTKSWAELGFPNASGAPSNIAETGAAWFEKQSDEIKSKILGKSGFEAFSEHGLSLDDFNGRRENETWGAMHQTRSPQAAIAAGKSRK